MSLIRKIQVYLKCLTRLCRRNSRRTAIIVLILLCLYTSLLVYLLNNSYEKSKEENLLIIDDEKVNLNKIERPAIENEGFAKNVILEKINQKPMKMRPDDYALNFKNEDQNQDINDKNSAQLEKSKNKQMKMRPDDYALNFKNEQNLK